MGIRIRLGELLRQYSNSRGIVDVNGDTIAACLQDFIRRYPRAGSWVFDRDGRLLVLINLNGESTLIKQERLDTKVKDGDELFLYMLLGGG